MWIFRPRSRLLPALGVLATVLVVAGCASSGTTLDTAGNPAAGPIAAPSAAGGSQFSGAFSSAGPGSSPGVTADTLQVVYTGSLQLVVADLPTALAKAKTAVAAVGGYIGASMETTTNDQPVAVMTYRIPSANWDDTVASLRGLATSVVAEQTQASEVGGQLVDLEARIRNLRASETALVAIAQSTAKVSDLLDVQAQLTDVRGQIEVLDAERARLADQVSYGTLVVTFGLETVAVQQTAKGWDPGKDVDAAAATLIEIGQTLARAAIWFAIVWLPLLVVLAVVLLLVRWGARRWMPKRRTAAATAPIEGWTDQR